VFYQRLVRLLPSKVKMAEKEILAIKNHANTSNGIKFAHYSLCVTKKLP
jgi:hypothetical protein